MQSKAKDPAMCSNWMFALAHLIALTVQLIVSSIMRNHPDNPPGVWGLFLISNVTVCFVLFRSVFLVAFFGLLDLGMTLAIPAAANARLRLTSSVASSMKPWGVERGRKNQQ
jgi:hypothetical protein